jgi:hypothetical protein
MTWLDVDIKEYFPVLQMYCGLLFNKIHSIEFFKQLNILVSFLSCILNKKEQQVNAALTNFHMVDCCPK